MKNNKTVNEAIAALDSNFVRVEQSLLRRERQQELDIALAESQITKWLPVHETTAAVDYLFTNPACARAVTTHIWAMMEAAGTKKTNVSTVTRAAAKVCFSSIMRAHMYVSEADAKRYKFTQVNTILKS